MRHQFFTLILSSFVIGGLASPLPSPEPESPRETVAVGRDGVVMPNPTNAVRLRLHTNASPDAAHLFNTFALEAYGEVLLQSPGCGGLPRRSAASASNTWLHHVLVNGRGPGLASTNGMTMIEQTSGREWSYRALDATAAYRDRLQQYKRAVLFVEPDLFVIHDHLVAREPVRFQMLLHPPAATTLDTNWGDLRLDLPKAGFRIHAPGRSGWLRSWKRIESAADALLPGTVTMELSPTNQVATLDVLTVFAVYPGGDKADYAFKLLESNTAVGARVHRQGLPTVVAFRTDPGAGSASLAGLGFSGPVGVGVFKPKPKPR